MSNKTLSGRIRALTDNLEVLNALDELSMLDAAVAGTPAASKVFIPNSNQVALLNLLFGMRPGGILGSLTTPVAFGGTGDNVEQAIHTATIPANTLAVGDIIRLRGLGAVSADNGTDTLTVRLVANFTGTPVEIISTGAVDADSADGQVAWDISMAVRSIGGSASLYCFGSISNGSTDVAVAAAKTIPSNAAITLSTVAVWSSENAGNNIDFQTSAVYLN